MKTVFLFHSPTSSRFCGGVFVSLEKAKNWILKHRLSGVLTKYPVDNGVYDWAILEGLFKPEKIEQSAPEFIGGFSSANQEHYHFENGICLD